MKFVISNTGYLLMSNYKSKWLVLRHGVEKYLVKNFEIFTPSSAGNVKLLGFHTRVAIIIIFPLLSKLLHLLNIKIKIEKAEIFCKKRKGLKNAKLLKKFFNKYKSDKSTVHNYHYIYGSLFKKKNNVRDVLEIGLGTNDEKLISNMGRYGRPGASIKAFRDFFLKAHIFGADIDKKILFKDKRIITYFTDQSNINELQKLYKKIGNKFDLIIDDGLHSPYTNINVIISSIKYLKKNGWIVIEDIPLIAKPIWEVLNYILSSKFHCILIQAKKSYVFLVNKK